MAREIDPAVSRYITMVQHLPRLTREEELEIATRWRTERDEKAKDALVRAHLRYVVAIALKYRRYGLPLAELIAEGNFGVVHALSKFEPERGNRFVTYAAYWIRAYMLNYIIRSWSLVSAGSGALRSKMFFKLRRERVRITNLVGEGDKADEMLAERFNMPKAQAVRVALEALDVRERFIVEKRLMADSEDELSLAEIGRRLGVSRERARQLEARAKRKLKNQIGDLGRQLVGIDSDVESAA